MLALRWRLGRSAVFSPSVSGKNKGHSSIHGGGHKDLGFSLRQVRELLSLCDQRRRSCEAVDAIARDHLAEVDRKIAGLAALRRELDSIISRCSHGSVAECRIIEALSQLAAAHAT
jgi:predicted mannosyl-3-phosphoglycerate phosphatase (HAD superfamily)